MVNNLSSSTKEDSTNSTSHWVSGTPEMGAIQSADVHSLYSSTALTKSAIKTDAASSQPTSPVLSSPSLRKRAPKEHSGFSLSKLTPKLSALKLSSSSSLKHSAGSLKHSTGSLKRGESSFAMHPLYPDFNYDALKVVIAKERKEADETKKQQAYETAVGGHDFLPSSKMASELDPREESSVAATQAVWLTTIILAYIALVLWSAFIWKLTQGNYLGFVLVAMIPMSILFMLFPIQVVYANFLACFGPISWLNKNTRLYSGVAPSVALIEQAKKNLPKITVQIPVYKESLELTIKPTVASAMAAIKAYRKEGGEANLVINDDGLVLISEEDRLCRLKFYRDNEIGYTARPGSNRKGKFKKASNMNYGLSKSVAVMTLMREEGLDYPSALRRLMQTLDMDREHGNLYIGGDIRVGDFILLLDSDSRVPAACMLPVMAEFSVAPDMAFTQHFTTPMQIQHDYWEDMISFFTFNIYDVGISLPVAWGFNTPLVGHNAFLRFDHMKQVAELDNSYWKPYEKRRLTGVDPLGDYESSSSSNSNSPTASPAPIGSVASQTPANLSSSLSIKVFDSTSDPVLSPVTSPATRGFSLEKPYSTYDAGQHDYYAFWSESHVSEDFQMSIRFLARGYFGRYIRYTGDDFKEGVSLTIHEELRKMQKFAYGVGELMFNPIFTWLWRGPFAPIFREYVTCGNITYKDKLVTIAYCGTYLAIGFVFVGTIVNYFVQGWFGYYKGFLAEPIDIIISCTIVFGGVCYTASCILAYRRGRGSLLWLFTKDLKHALLMGYFFSGLGYHLMIMLVKYLFGLHTEWGSTVKEVENTNFFKEIRKTFLGYKWMYLLYLFFTGVVFTLWYFPEPYSYWRIQSMRAVLPFALHIFVTMTMPIVLNPTLMRVKF